MSGSICAYCVVFFLHARNPASPSPKLHRHSEHGSGTAVMLSTPSWAMMGGPGNTANGLWKMRSEVTFVNSVSTLPWSPVSENESIRNSACAPIAPRWQQHRPRDGRIRGRATYRVLEVKPNVEVSCTEVSQVHRNR